jgi:proline iminopeptidase
LKQGFCVAVLIALFSLCLKAQTLQEGQVAREGFMLHYKSLGTGKPLLVLSGGPGFDVDYMTPVAQDLSHWYRVVLLEQRGTGRSQPHPLSSENLNLKLLVEDIEALRASLGVDRLVVLGHSWGGMLAMAYAAAHPDHADSLVLVASGGTDPSFSATFLDNIVARASTNERQNIQALSAELSHEPQVAWFKLFHVLVPYYFFDRAAGEKFISASTPDSFHPDTQQLLQREIQQNYDLRNQLKTFRGPVLIIQGHQDPMPEGVAEQTHSLIQNSQLVFLDRCGHFPWVEQPSAFYEQVHRFLKAEQN